MVVIFTDEDKEKKSAKSNIRKILQSVSPPINNNSRFKWLRVIGSYFGLQSHVWESVISANTWETKESPHTAYWEGTFHAGKHLVQKD